VGGGGQAGHVRDQWKRKTILTAENHFPYVKKRIPVRHKQEVSSLLLLLPLQIRPDEFLERRILVRQLTQPQCFVAAARPIHNGGRRA
jgi:hypothetical protein